jgi:hypothetical protein
MTYAPLDSDILESSVMLEGPLVFAVWCAILARKDRDGNTSLKPRTLWILWSRAPDAPSLEAVQKAWDVLAKNDPSSANPDHAGRRIIPTEDGRWFVVSAEKYRERYSNERRRKQLAEAQSRFKKKQKDQVAEYDANPPTPPTPDQEADALWHKTVDGMRGGIIGKQMWDTYVRPTFAVGLENGVLKVVVPSKSHLDYLAQHAADFRAAALACGALPEGGDVHLVLAGGEK